MKRSRRSDGHKAFSRPMNLLKKGLRRLTRAGALAGAAGETGFDFERLEERQLLFTLTVDPSDPSFAPDPVIPNFGTVHALFDVFIPYFAPAQAPEQQQPPRVTNENFDQNVPGDPGPFPNSFPIPAAAAPGFIFPQSNLAVFYTANSLALRRQDAAAQNQNLLVAG